MTENECTRCGEVIDSNGLCPRCDYPPKKGYGMTPMPDKKHARLR